MENQLTLKAALADIQLLRHTPAGLPALDLLLEHESVQSDAGARRQVKATVRAVAFGTLAERLARQAPASVWTFKGFVAAGRGGKGLVLHIQEIQQD